jgi:hypothetical protein
MYRRFPIKLTKRPEQRVLIFLKKLEKLAKVHKVIFVPAVKKTRFSFYLQWSKTHFFCPGKKKFSDREELKRVEINFES